MRPFVCIHHFAIRAHANLIHPIHDRWKVPEHNAAVARKLARFEPRLVEGSITYSIRGKGGNAACSYVLSLTDMEKVAS
jgi:hypothetical protein